MDLQQRIAQLEAELQLAQRETAGWNERRLRSEGALAALKQLEGEMNAGLTNDLGVASDSDGASGEPVQNRHVQ